VGSPRVDALKEFIRQRPADPFPRYALALEYKNNGLLEEARALFEELMAASPDYTAAYLHAGSVLVSLGRHDDARGVFQRGIAACLRSADAHARGELETALATLSP
jgi:tetratricopeptide (TPR) repeat protein